MPALNKEMDIQTKLMRTDKQVPVWWFQIILVANIALTIFVCEYYNDVLQLPWWGVLMACGLSIFFTLLLVSSLPPQTRLVLNGYYGQWPIKAVQVFLSTSFIVNVKFELVIHALPLNKWCIKMFYTNTKLKAR